MEQPGTPGASNAGFVGIGYTTPPRHLTITTQGVTSLLGFPPSMVELLVAGGIENDNTGWVQESITVMQIAHNSHK